MMMILVVTKILMVITRGRDDSDEGKAVMIKNDSAPIMRIRRKMLMIMFMLIATMSNKNQALPAHRADRGCPGYGGHRPT